MLIILLRKEGLKIKNRKLIVLLLTIALLLIAATAALAEENSNVNVITVNGQGTVKTIPDRANVALAVVTEATTAKQAQIDNAQKIAKAIQALKNSGIAEQDIKTQNYNLQPRYSYEEKQAPVILGYTVQNEILVTVKKTEQVGNVLDIAVDNGINQIRNISFYVENDQSFKVQALQKAVADARAKADVLAAALGKKIVGVKSAGGNWNNNNPGPIYYDREISYGSAGKAAKTAISPGELEITAYVDIVYIIE